MRHSLLLGLCAAVVLAVISTTPALAEEEPAVTTVEVGRHRGSGPYVHKNLAVYVVRGEDSVAGKTFMTLDEALGQELAVVHETSNVQELSVENRSDVVHLYIQSGVIVKGGKQDRTIRYDMILPPNSGRVPIASFCVESGRWGQRGGESAAGFSGGAANLPMLQLREAVKIEGSQQAVWENVRKAQEELGRNLGDEVRAPESATSLQLTLESPRVRESAAEYVEALTGAFADKPDAIGFAFAINGEMNTVDIYGSSALFRKLLPALLDAGAVEAIARHDAEKEFEAPAPDAVRDLMRDAEEGEATERDLTHGARMTVKQSENNALFRVFNSAEPDAVYRLEIMNRK